MNTAPWNVRLKEQVERSYKNYSIHRIALDDALDNKELPFAGDTIIVYNASSATALATVRLNQSKNDELPLKLGKFIRTVFTKFFVTCSAQAGGYLDCIVGVDFDFGDIDLLIAAFAGLTPSGETANPCIIITNASANVDTQGAANACKKVLIKAPTTNTGIVWVNFGAAAVDGSCYDLVPGSVVSAPTTNTDQVHALFKVANEKVIVVFVN